jgi:diguanylate cyclase (GGDEF)-like protein
VASDRGGEREYAAALRALIAGLDRAEVSRRLLGAALRLARARAGEVVLRDPAGDEIVSARRGRAGVDKPLRLPLRADGASLGVLRIHAAPAPGALRLRLLRQLAAAGGRALAAACVHEAALRRAELDPLTGLANHGQIWTALEREVAHAARYGRALSVVMLDLDGFKRWNDRHGHVAGDGALRCAARVIASGTRASDTAGRYGGDEFALILPETPRPGAIAVAEKVRAAIEAECPDGDPFTVSAGIACAPDDGVSAAALVRAADARLYAAKAAGGNRVVSANG